MARIKLSFPGNIIFTAAVPVRITDINYGNHLGNDALVSIIHEARIQWLASAGHTELSVAGAGLIMSDLAVEYKSESFYGDLLLVQIAVAGISAVSFEIYYSISTERDKKNLLIANAKTGIVCYDYALKKVTAIPAVFRVFLSGGNK